MPIEPTIKRASVFFDGQNLFYAAKDAFGYVFPNYDPELLAHAVCRINGWVVRSIHFYTGIPSAADNPFWNSFWVKKLGLIGKRGVKTFSRPLRYRNQLVRLQDGTIATALVGEEKGIDVRIAIDVVRMARIDEFDVCVIFSQDQDLSEVADEIKEISIAQGRWIKVVSAFPVSPTYANKRGINRTNWIKIERVLYDRCIDPNDYRPKTTPPV